MSNITAAQPYKLERLLARGDHYDIGYALGKAADATLRDVVPAIGRFRELKQRADARRELAGLEAMARDAFPNLMREVEGIADGAGVAFEDVWIWNCRGDLPGGGDQSREALAGCTSVMIAGRGEQPHIIAHNEDDQPELDGRCFIARVEPDDGPGFTSFYSPGLLPGHTFAINDLGLVQAINHVRPYDQRRGVPRHLIARAVLAQKSLDDALLLLKRSDRASGFHHNLGMSGDNRLLSVEAPARGCSVKIVDDGPSAHSNHLVYPPFDTQPQEVTPSSRDRLERANSLIAEGALGGRDPCVILMDKTPAGLPIYRDGKHLQDTGCTLATAVFEISSTHIDWRVHTERTGSAELVDQLSLS